MSICIMGGTKMKTIIWGAGKGSQRALEVCQALNWRITAVIDSDPRKTGRKIGEHIIQLPCILKDIDRETYIITASANPDMLESAQKYTDLIIDWNTLSILYRGAAQYPDYKTEKLEDKHIKNCRLLSDREILLEKLSGHYNKKFSFAEIGVAFGDFSRKVLDICSPSKLYLIDAWEGERYEKGLETVKTNLKDEIADGVVEIIRGYSSAALEELQDSSIDIVYIDTDHTYETTWEELLICARKVRADGFICGHDYTKYNPYSRMDYGVYDAVNRFCAEYNYEIYYLTMEVDGCHSYALKGLDR